MGVEGCAVFQLRKHLPLHIAQQASSMQHYLHQLIDEDEILSLKYSDPDICPNICVLRKWNDNVSNKRYSLNVCVYTAYIILFIILLWKKIQWYNNTRNTG